MRCSPPGHPLDTHTLARHTPPDRHPLWADPRPPAPSRRLVLGTVRILLECILVWNENWKKKLKCSNTELWLTRVFKSDTFRQLHFIDSRWIHPDFETQGRRHQNTTTLTMYELFIVRLTWISLCPPTVQNFLKFMQFFGNFHKSVFLSLPGGLAPLTCGESWTCPCLGLKPEHDIFSSVNFPSRV